MSIPERARAEMTKRLNQRWEERWPDLKDLSVRFRGSFAYIEGGLPEGFTMPLFRLRYIGSPKVWGFAIFLASKSGYEDSVLPSGSFTGTPEEALDCACGLYLRDYSAWQLDPNVPRHRTSRESQPADRSKDRQSAPLKTTSDRECSY